MTVAERRAIMQSPLYIPELDLLAIAPAGALAAFCLGGFNDVEKKVAYTNPIGTHPRYQRFGLAKALVSVALLLVRNSGAEKVEIGTSSENIPMNRLACSLGFHQVSEKLWFSKTIT
jgi:mycothiol synthase